jgi:hypothetical protein
MHPNVDSYIHIYIITFTYNHATHSHNHIHILSCWFIYFTLLLLVSLLLASFCWTKSLLCNDAFKQGSAIQSGSRRFCIVYKSEKSDPLQPFGRRDIPSGRPSVQSIIRLDDKNFLSGPSSGSRSFELIQLASVQTFHQHVRTTLSIRPTMGFPFERAHP